MAEQIAQAYVRIRPDLHGFKGELQSQLKEQLSGASVSAPLAETKVSTAGHTRLVGVLGEERGSFVATGRAAAAASAQQVAGSRAALGSIEAQTAARLKLTQTIAGQAEATVAAAVAERQTDEALLRQYVRLAAAAKAGSAEQIAATRLVISEQRRLGVVAVGTAEKINLLPAGLGRAERGALAASGVFRGLGRSLAFASGGFIGAFAVIGLVRKSIEDATKLESAISGTPIIFGRSALAAEAFAGSAYHALGLAKETALSAVDSFGRLFVGLGLLPAEAEKLSESLTKVGAAISLARGEEDPAAANAAIIGGLAGRGLALKRYGIILDQTTIKAEALRLGLVASSQVDPVKVDVAFQKLIEAQAALRAEQTKAVPDGLAVARAQTAITVAHAGLAKALAGTSVELTRQQKAQASASLIQAQGARYVADYANALDSSAGKQRQFHQGVKELREEVGTFLLPAFNKGITAVNHWIASVAEGGPNHKEFIADLRTVGDVTTDAWKALTLAKQILEDISIPLGGVKNTLEIIATLWTANKILTWVDALKKARIAAILFGGAAGGAGAAGAGEKAAETSALKRLGVDVGAGAAGAAGAKQLGKIAALKNLLGSLPRVVRIGLVVEVAYEVAKSQASADPDVPFANIAKKHFRDLAQYPRLRELLVKKAEHADDLTVEDVKALNALIGAGKDHPWGRGHYFPKAAMAILGPDTRPLKAGASLAGLAGLSPGARRTSIKAELDALTKTIESGTEFTVGRAKTLAARLAQAMGVLGTAGFGPAQRAKLRAEVLKLAGELANATKDIGTAALANLRKDRADLAQQITELNQRISDSIKEGGEQLAEAVRSASQAEHDAILSAKSNLNQLGQTLADQITQIVDATGESTKPTGPLARELDRLNKLIHEGKATPELIRQAQKVESQLNQQQAAKADKSGRITRTVEDLTAEFNAGKISLAKFNREVAALLKREHVTYRSAGKSLGFASVEGFKETLKELRAQAREIARTPAGLRRSVSGLEQPVVSPREVIKEQNREIAKIASDNAKELKDEIKQRSARQIKEARDDAAIARIQRHNIVAAIRDTGAPPGVDPKLSPAEAVRKAAKQITDAQQGVAKAAAEAVDSIQGKNNKQLQKAIEVFGDDFKIDFGTAERLARGQRHSILHENRTQSGKLQDIYGRQHTTNNLLRDIERALNKPRPRGGHNSRSAAETREAANHNLSI